MTTPNNTQRRLQREGHPLWVSVDEIVVNPLAQQQLRISHARSIASGFDPEKFGMPIVSHRDGKYFVMDGQHRVEALRIMGWDDQAIQCWVYEGLTEAQEAEHFLGHNYRKNVQAFDQFEVGITAGRDEENDIRRIVLAAGLKVSRDADGIAAVTALRKVYRHSPSTLARTLKIIRDAYGPRASRPTDSLRGSVWSAPATTATSTTAVPSRSLEGCAPESAVSRTRRTSSRSRLAARCRIAWRLRWSRRTTRGGAARSCLRGGRDELHRER